MTDQHRIVTRFVQFTVDGIAQCEWLQTAAGTKHKRLVICESEIRFECGLYGQAHLCTQILTCV